MSLFDCENAWTVIRNKKRLLRADWVNVDRGRTVGRTREWHFRDGSRLVAGPVHLRGYGNKFFNRNKILFSDLTRNYD